MLSQCPVQSEEADPGCWLLEAREVSREQERGDRGSLFIMRILEKIYVFEFVKREDQSLLN